MIILEIILKIHREGIPGHGFYAQTKIVTELSGSEIMNLIPS